MLMCNSNINTEHTMQHHISTSQLSHTVTMTPAEACQVMAYLAEADRLATGPQVPSHKDFDMEVTISAGQTLLGGLVLIVRP